MTKQRYNKLGTFASRSVELINYSDYVNNYEWTSDIQGDNVDIVIYDDGYDITHYEFRDNIQLVDWGYLVDNPTCTYEEWRAQDVTYDELNNTLKGYFQEILDDWASNDGISYGGSRVWSPAALHNFYWGSAYFQKLKRDGKWRRLGIYYNFGAGGHGTNTLSNIVGKTCGLAKKSPVYIIEHNWAKSLGFSHMDLPALLAQCKTRSGISRPTVRSMSMTFTHEQTRTSNVVKVGAISESTQKVGPLGGVINITIPEKIRHFCDLYRKQLPPHTYNPNMVYPDGMLYFTGSLDYSEELINTIKSQNDTIDYVEQTFQLVPRRRVRRDYTTMNISRYRVITTDEAFKTPDQQPHKELHDTFYNNNGYVIRSAGNSGELWTSYDDMLAVQERHRKEKPGGSVKTQQWDTGSVINIGASTLNSLSFLAESEGTIYGIQGTHHYNFYTSSLFASSGNTIEEKGVHGHLSGSNVSLQDIGLVHPYVWRVRPIFSNLAADAVWNSSGKSFESFSTGSQAFKNIFITGSDGYYTPDLNIIRNDTDFIAAGGTIVTGSVANGTLPSILDMRIELPDEDDVDVDFDIKYDLYHHNGAYHVEQHQFGERLQDEHPSRTAILFYFQLMMSGDGFNLGLPLTTPGQSFDGLGKLVGLLWEPYDTDDNLIHDKPLAAKIPLRDDAWSKFLLIDKTNSDIFRLSGPITELQNYHIIGETPFHGGNHRFIDGFGYNTLYFSGSLNTNTAIDLTNYQTYNNNVNYIFNEDTDDVYTKIKTFGPGSFFPLEFDDNPISEWYLNSRTDFDNYILLLKESPSIGRNLRAVTQSYSPIKLGGWPMQQDVDERSMLAASTAFTHQVDPFRPHVLSQSLHFPSTVLTSSYTPGYKHFQVNPTSSGTTDFLKPEDVLAAHTCRGSRIAIGTPGRHVNVAGAWDSKLRYGATLLDHFNTSSVYYKLPFRLASCSFDNMRTSAGAPIPQLGFMTGSQPTSSDNWVLRECVDMSHYETYYVDDTGKVNGYKYNSGTSFACPLLAGLSALWLDLYPKLTHYELRDLLRATGYRGFLRDEPITGDTSKASTINDFDAWMFGATHRYPHHITDITSGPGSFSGSELLQRQNIFEFGNVGVNPNAYNQYLSELVIRKHLTSRTTNYSLLNLFGTPNIIGRWPYSQTNRADIAGSFANLIFSGSITVNNG